MSGWGARVAGALVILVALGACDTTYAPTYANGKVTIIRCPSARLIPRRHTTIAFVVVSRSRWPATYILLTLQGEAKGTLNVAQAPSKGIGGGIERVTQPLSPGAKLAGTVSAYLDKAQSGSVNIGAWGAPANSVAVPTSYSNPGCTLHPQR